MDNKEEEEQQIDEKADYKFLLIISGLVIGVLIIFAVIIISIMQSV